MSEKNKKNDAKHDLRILGRQISELSKTSIWETCKAYGLAWAIILFSSLIIFYMPNFNYLFKFFFSLLIAAQLHGLLVLMHGAAHWHFSTKKSLNDWISDLLSAWPVLVSTDSYRKHHNFHHQFTNTEADPDWARRIHKKTWQYPMTKQSFYKALAPYFFGAGIIEMIMIQLILNKGWKDVNTPRLLIRLVFSMALFYSLYLVGSASLWIYFIPVYIILPFLMRVRSIAEHWGLSYVNEYEDSRNIHANFVERFLFGPFDNHLHLVHHLLPAVPWYRAKAAHDLLCKIPNYRNSKSQTYGYFIPLNNSEGKTLYEQITY